MPYVRIWIHLVWSTKNREPFLLKETRAQVFGHIKENAKKKDIYLDSIDGTCDHVHALIKLDTEQTIANVARLLKGESSHWANSNRVSPSRFEWQDDYYAASVSESDVEAIRRYIAGQEEHHRIKSFSEEYENLITQQLGKQTGLKPN